MIGKIKRVPLRELWRTEDKDFTKWLEDNIEHLSEILPFDIAIESREEPVGPFRVDLYGEDNSGNKIIIENQLEKTDHDHLGKVVTYLTNLDAKTAVWISSNPTTEHIKAIEWLNEITPDDISFYLIKIEAVKIGDQPMAAPLFTITKGPSVESKKIGAEKKEYAQRHILRNEFWTQLLEKSKDITKLFSNVSASRENWLGAGAGKSGIRYVYVIANKYVRCEIYLDRGKEFEEPNINKMRFDRLILHRDEIERELGQSLNWERLDDKRASRISIHFDDVGLKDEDKWDEMQNKMIETMIKMDRVFGKFIQQLD